MASKCLCIGASCQACQEDDMVVKLNKARQAKHQGNKEMSCIQQQSLEICIFDVEGEPKPWTVAPDAKGFIIKANNKLKGPESPDYESQDDVIDRLGISGQMERYLDNPRAQKDIQNSIRYAEKVYPRNAKVVLNPDYVEAFCMSHPDHPKLDINSGSFKRGRALMPQTIKIFTCVGWDRPRTVYRVIHGAQPHGGTKPRSYGSHHTDSVWFIHDIHRHANWTCRALSPFMSVTTDRSRALRVANVYSNKGFQDITILTIDMNVKEWQDEKKRVWSHTDLVRRGLRTSNLDKPYFGSEYYIEDGIPQSAIIRRESHRTGEYKPRESYQNKRPNPTVDSRNVPSNKRMRVSM